MTDHATTPDDTDDDALADAIADELEARALQDPVFCRELARAVKRAAKGEKHPSEMTQKELAAKWGITRRKLNREVLKAIRKLRFTPEVQSLKPHS